MSGSDTLRPGLAPPREDAAGAYDAADVPAAQQARSTAPGTEPFLRGPYPGMYTVRPWTMRQYAGFGSAEQTNERFRMLLDRGQTGLSVAFDLPTQLGLDSDDPRSLGEVGRTGVAIDSVADMRRLFDGIDLGAVSTSMTINAPAALLLLMYDIVASEQGVATSDISGTIQNDILKEYAARGNYMFPPAPSMRLTVDTFAWCAKHAPRFNTISISGYHIREAGSTAVQELAFTLGNGIAYVRSAAGAGLDVEAIAPRLSFFFNAHNDFFVEVAKFRAARVLWDELLADLGVQDAKARRLRFHAQTGGSTLTAQQPLNNVVRVAIQAFAAACGGAQSIHTNGYDEALALPTEESAELALRTQQVLAHESGIIAAADPLGGSHYIEALTDSLINDAHALLAELDEAGGAIRAIEDGWMQSRIEDAAYEWQQSVEDGSRVLVGVNRYERDEATEPELHRLDPKLERTQCERVAAARSSRNEAAVVSCLAAVRAAAAGTDNLLPTLREALVAGATLGECCNVLRDVWGTFD